MNDVYELAPAYYGRARHLFEDIFEEAAVSAVLEGRRQYDVAVLVDNPEDPRTALVAYTENYYLAGQLHEGLQQFILDSPPEARLFMRPAFCYYGVHPAWQSWLLEAAPSRVARASRRSFRRPPQSPIPPDWRERIPQDVRIQALDALLAERIDRELSEQYIGPIWNDNPKDHGRFPRPGYARFAQASFGYALLIEKQIASTCWGMAVSSQAASVEVETAEAYRGRGFGTLAGWAWVEACQARGLYSEWICDVTNEASARMALRLGHIEGPTVSKLYWRNWGQEIPRVSERWQAQKSDFGSVWKLR